MSKSASRFLQHGSRMAAGLYRPGKKQAVYKKGKKKKGRSKNEQQSERIKQLSHLLDKFEKCSPTKKEKIRPHIFSIWAKIQQIGLDGVEEETGRLAELCSERLMLLTSKKTDCQGIQER